MQNLSIRCYESAEEHGPNDWIAKCDGPTLQKVKSVFNLLCQQDEFYDEIDPDEDEICKPLQEHGDCCGGLGEILIVVPKAQWYGHEIHHRAIGFIDDKTNTFIICEIGTKPVPDFFKQKDRGWYKRMCRLVKKRFGEICRGEAGTSELRYPTNSEVSS